MSEWGVSRWGSHEQGSEVSKENEWSLIEGKGEGVEGYPGAHLQGQHSRQLPRFTFVGALALITVEKKNKF